MLQGALFGAIGGIIGIIIVFFLKKQKTANLKNSVAGLAVEYSGFFYYASPNRFQKALRVYDSTGLLYLIGNTVFYKTGTTANPIAFNLSTCFIQMEPDWRNLKWFSITTPGGEKYYFDSFKMGAFSNDSNETLNAYTIFKSKTYASPVGTTTHPPPPPPPLN
jgi:hypothetical protein